jgi:hypothetical protein
MRDFAIMTLLTLPMQLAGLTLLFVDEAAVSAACVMGTNLVAVVLKIVWSDLARLSRVLRQGHGSRADGLMDYSTVPDGIDILAWF